MGDSAQMQQALERIRNEAPAPAKLLEAALKRYVDRFDKAVHQHYQSNAYGEAQTANGQYLAYAQMLSLLLPKTDSSLT